MSALEEHVKTETRVNKAGQKYQRVVYDAAPGSVLNLSNDQYIDLDKVTPEDMIESLHQELASLEDEMQRCRDRLNNLIQREPSTIPHPREDEWRRVINSKNEFLIDVKGWNSSSSYSLLFWAFLIDTGWRDDVLVLLGQSPLFRRLQGLVEREQWYY